MVRSVYQAACRVSLLALVCLAACDQGSSPCTPEAREAFCARTGTICGPATGVDNCGAQRTEDCGLTACSGEQGCTANRTCGDCDPTLAWSCGEGLVCRTLGDRKACKPASFGQLMGPCDKDGDCQEGLGCFFGGVCRKLCDKFDGNSCGANHVCEDLDTLSGGALVAGCRSLEKCRANDPSACPAGQGCYWLGAAVECAIAGTKNAGELCALALECRPGLDCSNSGYCVHTCAKSNPTVCSSDEMCSLLPSPWNDYGICFKFCSPLIRDTCAPSRGCYTTDGSKYMCAIAGTKTPGQACAADSECQPEWGCHPKAKACHRYCDLDLPQSENGCPSGTKCVQADEEDIYGLCISFKECDPRQFGSCGAEGACYYSADLKAFGCGKPRAGAGGNGAACSVHVDCLAGFDCWGDTDGACFAYCDSMDGSPGCPVSQVCEPISASFPGVGACAPPQ